MSALDKEDIAKLVGEFERVIKDIYLPQATTMIAEQIASDITAEVVARVNRGFEQRLDEHEIGVRRIARQVIVDEIVQRLDVSVMFAHRPFDRDAALEAIKQHDYATGRRVEFDTDHVHAVSNRDEGVARS